MTTTTLKTRPASISLNARSVGPLTWSHQTPTSLIKYSTTGALPDPTIKRPQATYTFCSKILKSSLPASNSTWVTNPPLDYIDCPPVPKYLQTLPNSVVFASALSPNTAAICCVKLMIPLYLKLMTAPLLSFKTLVTSRRRCLPEGSWRMKSDP
jgi:hypothetical protein